MYTAANIASNASPRAGRSSPSSLRINPPVRSPWVCDPAFGIVHQENCPTCLSYMLHVVNGSLHSDTEIDRSFHEAAAERDEERTILYLNGLEEGRKVQAEKDRTMLHRYREERDEACAKRMSAEDEVKRLRKEMAAMRDAMMALQMAYEQVTEEQRYGRVQGADDEETFCLVELQCALLEEAKTAMESEAEVALAISQDEVADSSPLDWMDRATGWKEDQYSEESSEGEDSGRQARTRSGQRSFKEAKAILDGLSQSLTSPAALIEVRDMLVDAYRTPKEERTTVQKYVLREAWKIPTVLGSGKASPAGVPLSPTLPEVFVDASGKGIGFLWGEKWAAWTLGDGWRSKGRDMQWAELVAVEMGVRTMIAAGLSSTHVRLRSDNQAVVKALANGSIGGKQEAPVLRRILDMCQEHGIVLVPVWVATKFNPADALSRGTFPCRAFHVNVPVSIPEELALLVRDIRVRSA